MSSPPTASPQAAHDVDADMELVAERLAAGHRVLVLASPDEARVLECVRAAAQSLGLEIAAAAPGADASLAALNAAEATHVVVACDALPHFGAVQRRQLREHAQRRRGAVLVLVQPTSPKAELLAPEVPLLELPPPDRAKLESALVDWVERVQRSADPQLADAVDALRDHSAPIAREALGLECFEFVQAMHLALARAQAATAALTASALLAAVREAKAARHGSGQVLESVAPVPLREVGGLNAFKAWMQRRALALDPRAHASGIPAPRGVMLVGVQGCGKSLAARSCADVLGLPLFRLDAGRLFEGVVGGSEAKLARTLAAIERMAPVVLWLDEVDKSLAGGDTSASDGGTAARVVGALLTWLQERERPVFVVATANDPGRLPAELQRRGRLDELFFVDLPDAATRARILEIHLAVKPQRELGEAPPFEGKLDAFTSLAREAEGFSGAELQAALIEARLDAFARQEPVAPSDLQRALSSTVPLSRARKESVEGLRQWAQDRARQA